MSTYLAHFGHRIWDLWSIQIALMARKAAIRVSSRPSFSFSTYMLEKPGGPTEIHDWVESIFREFRELELRLLMGHVSASLRGAPLRAVPRAR